MSNNISLFTGYSQKENRTTNYTMLILKLIYEENPKFLSEIFSNIFNENIGGSVGVKFHQQVKKKKSVPDGLIKQSSFNIYIETKNFDWFYDSQLENHLEGISEEKEEIKLLIALGNFEEDLDRKFENIINICKEKYQNKIFFKALTFEDILIAIKVPDLSKNLKDVILDYENYLNEENLLPNWKTYLDVINCAGLPDDILLHNVYMCPATGGAYNHSRCKYFGMYKNKRVEKVGMIEAVVDVLDFENAKLKWKNINKKSKELEKLAIEKVKGTRNEYPTRIFLLGELFETNFIKNSKGGMLGSKQYFDIKSFDVKNAKDLAEKLNNKSWDELNLK